MGRRLGQPATKPRAGGLRAVGWASHCRRSLAAPVQSGDVRVKGAHVRVGLTARLLLATGVLALIVAAAFGFLLFAMADVSRATGDATHSLEEGNVARDTRRLLVDME